MAGTETVTVKQRDWPDYFPDISRKASVYEPEFEEVDMSYVTPHTTWARPYYGRKIKALVVAARVAHRDTVELAQRLEMEFDTISSFSRLKLGGSEAGRYSMPVGFSEAEQRLKLAGFLKKDHDVIIIGKMSADAIPDDLQARIREQVAAGTGLIFSYFNGDESSVVPAWARAAQSCRTGEAEEICMGIPFEAVDAWREYKTPGEAAAKILTLKKLGKGRIAIIRVGGKASRGYLVPAPTEFKEEIKLWPVDYYISLAARVTEWAAQQAPLGRLQCKATGRDISVEIAGVNCGWDEVDFKVRDEWGNEAYHACGRKTTARLPELPGGNYTVDAILRKNGRTLNWGSTTFSVERESLIKSMEAWPKGIIPGEEFTINVKMNNALKENGALEAQVEDMKGRLIVRIKKELTAGDTVAEIKGKMNNPMGNLARARVFLIAGNRLLCKGESYLPVKSSCPTDDFGFVCWDLASSEYNWHYARKELEKLGVDTSYGGRSYQEAWIQATAGFHPIPYMTRYAISRTTPGPRFERIPCLSDPEYIMTEQKKIKKSAEEMSVFGAAGYSLGDENDLSLNNHEVCFSPSCLEAFRTYIRKTYGNSLDAVNAEWGLTNAAWEEIAPIPLWKAQAAKQPARWVDFRMSMEDVFLKTHQLGSETVKSVDKNALVGFDGGFDITSFAGYDLWKLSRILDVWGIYPDHLQAEILRSFHRPTARTGRWYGGYYNITRFTEYAHWEAWYDLFHEINNVWWFNIIGGDGGGCQAEDTMNPASFKAFPILEATAKETREIKSGAGKLLLGCRRDSDGIAILYSQASLHAATFYNMKHNPSDSQLDFIKILEDLGCNYRFVSYEQVKEGMLDKEGYRLLILPCAVALSKTERERIKAFLDNGGKVLADDIPGIYDEHGREIADEQWRRLVAEKIKVFGEVVRNYRRKAAYGKAMRSYMRNVLRDMAIEPEIKLIPEGKDVYEGELAVFHDGPATYVGLLRDHSPAHDNQKAVILLPRAGSIYDMRLGKHMGQNKKIETDLKAGAAGLWAIMPSETGELKIHMPREAKPGESVKCGITVGDSYRHVVRLDVIDGNGNKRLEYGQNLECKHGLAEGVLPLALNDVPGEWSVTVRDVGCGSRVRQTLCVTP